MIYLTRLNHTRIVLNADLIEHIEVTPDTVIVLTTGERFMVRETADDVVNRVIHFRRSILAAVPPVVSSELEISPSSAQGFRTHE